MNQAKLREAVAGGRHDAREGIIDGTTGPSSVDEARIGIVQTRDAARATGDGRRGRGVQRRMVGGPVRGAPSRVREPGGKVAGMDAAHAERIRAAWMGVLWDAQGRRVLPRTADLDAAIIRNRWRHEPRMQDYGEVVELGHATFGHFGFPGLYHLPTVEWVTGVVALAKSLCVQRALEVGAGDGFTSACLRAAGLPIRATDGGSWEIAPTEDEVEHLDAEAAVEKYDPDFVIWCWSPIGSAEASVPDRVARRVRWYLSVGEGFDAATSHPDEGLPHRELPELDAVTRCRTDYAAEACAWAPTGVSLHGHNYLFTKEGE